jgi:shikimate kinase/phosphopantetheine adenylyltransferase
MKILIMGLPGSGKTTLAEKLYWKLLDNKKEVHYANADEIRSLFEDWDFSGEGRLRQAERMSTYADSAIEKGLISICDFVCPTENLRNVFQKNKKADIIIWMHTEKESKYEDTNKLFEHPSEYTFKITEKDADKWVDIIYKYIESGAKKFDYKAPTVQMLGRYQPFHDGHIALFERAIAKTGQVCIMVRDCQNVGDNPFAFTYVKNYIEERLQEKYTGKYIVIKVPNIVNITYGRDVGYTIEKEEFDAEIEAISATNIRKAMFTSDNTQ